MIEVLHGTDAGLLDRRTALEVEHHAVCRRTANGHFPHAGTARRTVAVVRVVAGTDDR